MAQCGQLLVCPLTVLLVFSTECSKIKINIEISLPTNSCLSISVVRRMRVEKPRETRSTWVHQLASIPEIIYNLDFPCVTFSVVVLSYTVYNHGTTGKNHLCASDKHVSVSFISVGCSFIAVLSMKPYDMN